MIGCRNDFQHDVQIVVRRVSVTVSSSGKPENVIVADGRYRTPIWSEGPTSGTLSKAVRRKLGIMNDITSHTF